MTAAMPGAAGLALLWRRLAAITYDLLLLAALWMITAMAVTVLSQLLQTHGSTRLMRALLLMVGLLFFAWFWSHGGQTLGMRAWRVRVERVDGTPLPFPAATLRYFAGALPVVCALFGAARYGAASMLLALVGYAPCLVAGGGRAFNDLVSGSRLVLLPRGSSAQPAQPPQRDRDEQQGRQAG